MKAEYSTAEAESANKNAFSYLVEYDQTLIINKQCHSKVYVSFHYTV